MTRKAKALIVGGGPSGLTVAYALQGDTLVLEREERVGGLCRSIEVDGGVFDVGGHSFHTPHPEVHDLIDGMTPGGLFKQQRDARVYSHGALIPYPFQRFYECLPDPDVVRACERGLAEVDASAPEPENFEQYIVQNFGQGIADHFMLPYNRKLWARDIGTISCEWTSERVAAPKGSASEKFDTAGGQRKPLQPDTRVGYPQEGGFERLFQGFADRVPGVLVNKQVIEIDPALRLARCADGSAYEWEFLVSTMPIPELVRVVRGTPPDIIALADSLDFMSLRVELLLAGRSLDTSIQRIYNADEEIPPHKIALNHNSSDSLRSRPRHAIMAEVSISEQKPVAVDSIAPVTIDLLCSLGVLGSPDDIIWKGHVDVKYAYPVYTHERPATVSAIKDWLVERHIYTVGRFGDWEYINSDKCVNNGLVLGRQLAEMYEMAAIQDGIQGV
jgi:protoporphyrinogen oxidase